MTATLQRSQSMSKPAEQPWRVSRDEYYRLAELGFFDGQHVERINGEIRVMSPTTWKHSLAVSLVDRALAKAFPGD